MANSNSYVAKCFMNGLTASNGNYSTDGAKLYGSDGKEMARMFIGGIILTVKDVPLIRELNDAIGRQYVHLDRKL